MAIQPLSSLNQSLPKPIESILECPPWMMRLVFSFLEAKDKTSCALSCKQWAVIVFCDPTLEWDRLPERAVATVKKLTRGASSSPTEKILNSNPTSKAERDRFLLIREEMRDPIVLQTFRNIVAREKITDSYPLYHAMNASVFCYTFFTGVLQTLSSPDTKAPLFLRFPDSKGAKTVDELTTAHSPLERRMYDHLLPVQQEILSTSPHLFTNLLDKGESTWHFFMHNKSVFPPLKEEFFHALCNQYHLVDDLEKRKPYIDQFIQLHARLTDCATKYINCMRPHPQDKTLGVILQIMVPEAIVDKVAYPSLAFGQPDGSHMPLSKSLKTIRDQPRLIPNLQVRILAQSLMIPAHRIEVTAHGYLDFFTATSSSIENKEAEKASRLRELIEERETIAEQARQLFTTMILSSAKKIVDKQ